MRKAIGWLFTSGGVAVWVVKGLFWLLNATGYAETAADIATNRGAILKAVISASELWPAGMFAIGVFVLAWIHWGSPRSWLASIRDKAPEPQEVFVAVDQLKSLLNKGRDMETAFQIPQKANPRHAEVHNWIAKVDQCARQKRLAGLVGPKELKKWNTDWSRPDVLRIESLLDRAGYFEGVDDVGRLTFRTIWGRVKRLEELIGSIEGAPGATDTASIRDPQAICVAHDELREMQHEGESMLDRIFLHGHFPTLQEAAEYQARTLAAARQQVFAPHVGIKELTKFQKEWDEMELLEQKAQLHDAGFLPAPLINPYAIVLFDMLYGRVQRLKELIAFIEGDSAMPAS